MHLTFLLAKDPTRQQVGDTAIMNRLLAIAGREHEVSIICWSDRDDAGSERIVRLAKPRVDPVRVGVRALARRQSLLHARYDDPGLRAAIEESTSDAYIAAHYYMAEALDRTRRRDVPLYAVNVVPEAAVWRHTRSRALRGQARAIDRDEARVIARARAVGSYDADDARVVAARGARRSVWLPITLPARSAVHVATTPPRLAVLGDRTWAPNEDAWQRMLALWPDIRAGIPGAELVAVGPSARQGRGTPLPDGVRDLGFVPDIDSVLGTCRGLAAPIGVGGGVRVKLLEAAAVGLPCVATTPATGSLRELLGIEPVDDYGEFVSACRRLLQEPAWAADEGRRLHEANVRHIDSGAAEEAVSDWLG